MKKSEKRLAILPRTQNMTTLSANIAPGTLSSFFSFCAFFLARGSTPVKTDGSEWFYVSKRFLTESVILRGTQYLTTLSANMAELARRHIFELCSFVVREPCLGLSGGLGEPWAPKFPDSAQPLKSLIFIKEYRSI